MECLDVLNKQRLFIRQLFAGLPQFPGAMSLVVLIKWNLSILRSKHQGSKKYRKWTIPRPNFQAQFRRSFYGLAIEISPLHRRLFYLHTSETALKSESIKTARHSIATSYFTV
jgi:hypothetical protein